MTDNKPLFDAIRTVKGSALTQADVDLINAVLRGGNYTRSGNVYENDPKTNTSDPDPELIAALKKDEGLRLNAYKDTVGVWTIGYGRAHVASNTVWNEGMAEAALIEDAKKHNAELYAALPWVKTLDPVRRRVLENMSFNLGINRLLGFKNTLEAVRAGRYNQAASGMLSSLWAKQVKGRAVRLAQEMLTGRA